jgi:hypothetical protein
LKSLESSILSPPYKLFPTIIHAYFIQLKMRYSSFIFLPSLLLLAHSYPIADPGVSTGTATGIGVGVCIILAGCISYAKSQFPKKEPVSADIHLAQIEHPSSNTPQHSSSTPQHLPTAHIV